jgi:disulfide bond formation protein DsbB
MTLFFAILTVAANVALVLLVVLAVGARFSAGLAGARDRVLDELGGSALLLAWLLALVATVGSLYYSEIAHFVPCPLCWYQRAAMYPLAIVLGIAALRRDSGIWPYGVSLALVGAAISIYHYQLEWFPGQQAIACSASVPCSAPYFRELGFMSLAYMALSGFLLIAALLLVARRSERLPERA